MISLILKFTKLKNKNIKIAISIVISIISYGFIIYKVSNFDNIKEITSSFNLFKFSDIIITMLVFILMVLNWSLETLKWKILISNIQALSFFSSLKAVLAGITIGIFTPNRIGEIGGRILYLNKGERTYGILATSIGSFAQFITTIICGCVGLIIYLIVFPEFVNISPLFNNLTIVAIFFCLLIMLWAYFNIQKLKFLLLKIPFLKKKSEQLNYFSKTQASTLIKTLLLSILRYSVFATQFFLLLIVFKVDISITQAYVSICLIYLFATIIPTTTLAELGIRGSLGIFFIGIFSTNIVGIVFSTLILWIINLAIPSIIGSVYLIKINH